MHPNEERPQGYWEVDDPPDPTDAQTDAEFVAELRELLRLSGLSVREIEHRARAYGGYLPEGTVSNALRGNTLPSEELLVPLLWAIGCDDETVEVWVWVRGRLAAANAQFDPAEIYWVPDEPKSYSEGALAHAVKERRNQSGWRGLHRRAIPDDGDAKHAPEHVRSHGFLLAIGWGTGWSSRAITLLVIAGVVTLAAGFAVALIGGDEVAAPPREGRGGQGCCPASPAPGAETPAATLQALLPSGAPTPSVSTKPASPTPRLTATTQKPGPNPTPTQTQTQTPRLTGSGSTTCAGPVDRWLVDLSVTATLTGAPSGTDPQGRAGQGGSLNPFPVSATGGTSFTGHASIDVGPNTAPAQGTIHWSVTVTVPGGGTVEANGNESYSCS